MKRKLAPEKKIRKKARLTERWRDMNEMYEAMIRREPLYERVGYPIDLETKLAYTNALPDLPPVLFQDIFEGAYEGPGAPWQRECYQSTHHWKDCKALIENLRSGEVIPPCLVDCLVNNLPTEMISREGAVMPLDLIFALVLNPSVEKKLRRVLFHIYFTGGHFEVAAESEINYGPRNAYWKSTPKVKISLQDFIDFVTYTSKYEKAEVIYWQPKLTDERFGYNGLWGSSKWTSIDLLRGTFA